MLLIANRQMLVFRIPVHAEFVKLSMTEFEKNAFAESAKAFFIYPFVRPAIREVKNTWIFKGETENAVYEFCIRAESAYSRTGGNIRL